MSWKEKLDEKVNVKEISSCCAFTLDGRVTPNRIVFMDFIAQLGVISHEQINSQCSPPQDSKMVQDLHLGERNHGTGEMPYTFWLLVL